MSPDVGSRIEVIGEHSIQSDLLRPGWILDAGSRGFDFAVEMTKRGCQVVTLDPAPDVNDPGVPGLIFRREALVGIPRNGLQPFVVAGNGSHLTTGPWPYRVQCVTVPELMLSIGVPFWEIVKLDCEGAEYEILHNWPGPIARQITVEFHDFLGGAPPGVAAAGHAEILAHLDQWYEVAQHEWTTQHGAGWNYWDSLFILQNGRAA